MRLPHPDVVVAHSDPPKVVQLGLDGAHPVPGPRVSLLHADAAPARRRPPVPEVAAPGPDAQDADLGVRECHDLDRAVVVVYGGPVLAHRLCDDASVILVAAEAHGDAAPERRRGRWRGRGASRRAPRGGGCGAATSASAAARTRAPAAAAAATFASASAAARAHARVRAPAATSASASA